VAVIGGGNTAIDAARTALRIAGPDGKVDILYRRTKNEMPADDEEVKQAVHEGVEIRELVVPAEIKRRDGRLRMTCYKTKLGEKDESGRQRPIKVDHSEFDLDFDAVIVAVGQNIILDFADFSELQPNSVTYETGLPNVYLGGDALRGPSTLITAIADGKKVANKIIQSTPKVRYSVICRTRLNLVLQVSAPRERAVYDTTFDKGLRFADYQIKSAKRIYGIHPEELAGQAKEDFSLVTQTLTEAQARKEADRCLYCDDICNVCVSVCPNRAMISYHIEPVKYDLQRAVLKDGRVHLTEAGTFTVDQRYQVLNIADCCNECGNCTTFCPTSGAPYMDKPKLCLSTASFESEPVAYRLERMNGQTSIQAKTNGRIESLSIEADEYIYQTDLFTATLEKSSFRIKRINVKGNLNAAVDFRHAAEMSVLLSALGDSYLSCC